MLSPRNQPSTQLMISPDLTNNLNTTLSASFNTLAHRKTKNISFNTSSHFTHLFTPELRQLKQTGNQLEQLTKKSSLTAHHEAYKLHLSA